MKEESQKDQKAPIIYVLPSMWRLNGMDKENVPSMEIISEMGDHQQFPCALSMLTAGPLEFSHHLVIFGTADDDMDHFRDALIRRWRTPSGAEEVQYCELPSGYVKIAIENYHRNSGFSHEK